LESFKVRANIDQFYISKVAVGQRGKFEFASRPYELEVVKIFPEVTNDVFQADLTFVGALPEGIKRGQTLQIDLGLSEAKATTMVAKGGFYRHTNGRWAYRLSDDGRSAMRVDIVAGRQNPQSVEILEGLKPGDWVIASNYENFNDVDELNFSEPVKH
jgi:HlyD family secretion protein